MSAPGLESRNAKHYAYAPEKKQWSDKAPLLMPWKEHPQTGVRPHSWTIFFGFLKHTFLHVFMFGLVSIAFMMWYHTIPTILVGITLFFIVALLSDAVWMYWLRKRLTKESVGFFVCAFAIGAGAVVGTSIQLTKLIDYWPYDLRRHYTNVAPDELASSKADASVIVFMQGARPDASRSMGYRRSGHYYCVAPIALEAGYSDEQNVSPNIQYWAVGKDCCMGHKGFICDDATNENARSGLVMMPMTGHNKLMQGLMSSDEMHYYEQGVLMTMAKFDLTSPKERLYVRFVEDIDKARTGYWNAAWWSWAKWQLAWAVVWIVVGTMSVVIGAGDADDDSNYMVHMGDAKQSALWKLNHWC